MSVPTGFDLQIGSRVGIRGWSDVEPATVVQVSASGSRVTVRRDRAALDPAWTPQLLPGGFAAHCANQSSQQWLITEDPAGARQSFSRRTDGRWWEVGCAQRQGSRLVEGWRKFHDFNF